MRPELCGQPTARAFWLVVVSDRHILAERPYAQPRGGPDRWYSRTGCHAAELASYAQGEHGRRPAWLAPADPGVLGAAGPGTDRSSATGRDRHRPFLRQRGPL